MRTTWFKSGDWNAICDVCGFKFKASELRERWDGLKVCSMDWELRHPQELARPIPDEPALPWTRPDPAAGNADLELYVQAGFCSATGRQGIADFGEADCAIVGLDLGYRTPPLVT